MGNPILLSITAMQMLRGRSNYFVLKVSDCNLQRSLKMLQKAQHLLHLLVWFPHRQWSRKPIRSWDSQNTYWRHTHRRKSKHFSVAAGNSAGMVKPSRRTAQQARRETEDRLPRVCRH